MKSAGVARMVLVVFLVCMVAGCVSVVKYEQPRVDQEITGNRGYVVGTPPPGSEVETDPTMKIYTLDVTFPPRKAEEDFTLPSAPKYTPAPVPSVPRSYAPPETGPGVLTTGRPAGPAAPAEEMKPEEPRTYKVERGDTLQKISKKFYGNHSSWKKIYEANKDKIKNPNRIRPGQVLVIP